MSFSKSLSVVRGRFAPSLLYLLIAIVPLLTYPLEINGITIHPRKIREIGLYSFAIIICTFLERNRWLRYFVIWCVINWWLNFFSPRESYIGLTNIFSAFVMYIAIKQLLKDKFLKVDIILKVICIMALFQFGWVIMQMFNIDPVFYPVSAQGVAMKVRMPLCGWSGNPVLLGSFFVCSAFLFLHYFKIKKLPILFFLILTSVFITRSATVAIAFSIGGLFYLLNKYPLNRRYMLMGILIITMLFVFFYFFKSPNMDRWLIWKRLITDGIKIRPFVGSGINFFGHLMILDKRTNTPWNEAHNDYLQLILELGIVGFSLFSIFIISKIKEFYKVIRNNKRICIASCLVAFLALAFSLFPMRLAQLSFYAITLLACLDYETKILQN